MVSSLGEMIFGGAKFSLHHRSDNMMGEKACDYIGTKTINF